MTEQKKAILLFSENNEKIEFPILKGSKGTDVIDIR